MTNLSHMMGNGRLRGIRNGTQAVPYGALADFRFNRPFHYRNLVGAVMTPPYDKQQFNGLLTKADGLMIHGPF